MDWRTISIAATGLGALAGLLDKLVTPQGNKPALIPVRTLQTHAIEYLRKEGKSVPSAKREFVRDIYDKADRIMSIVNEDKLDPFIYDLASLIAVKSGGRNQIAQLTMMHALLSREIEYVRDVANVDIFQHSVRTIANGRADCDCFTILYLSVAAAMGIYGYAKIVRLYSIENGQKVPAREWGHIYPMFEVGNVDSMGKLSGGLVPIDPTVKDPITSRVKPVGWEAPSSMISEWIVFDLTGKKVGTSK
jgi:hypothetical protein